MKPAIVYMYVSFPSVYDFSEFMTKFQIHKEDIVDVNLHSGNICAVVLYLTVEDAKMIIQDNSYANIVGKPDARRIINMDVTPIPSSARRHRY